MATEEWLLKAIQTGKNYEELPPRVRSILPVNEWKSRVKEYCVMRGLSWSNSQASQVSSEMEYYEELLRYSKSVYRLFPYHLSDYVCRVLRVSAFRYYCDVLYNALKEEKPYDQIPNFTAADIKRLSGIGRNEYIEILNQCKAKKLLWRVNKGIAREHLPAEPLEIQLEPWWHVGVVNIGEMEYRALTPEELKTLQDACFPGGSQVKSLDEVIIMDLFKRGLVYIEIPIQPDDVVSIPHLEGFVSNRDAAGIHADPMEALLHQVFVAASENITVAELAEMLSVDLARVRSAVSIALRLRFAQRLPRSDADRIPEAGSEMYRASELATGSSPGGIPAEAAAGASALEDASSSLAEVTAGGSKAIALVVDATVTSYLMMGNLPGLKRHAVTLFEGGRVSGAEPMGSLISELRDVSEERLEMFEGEMQELMAHTAALAHALDCVQSSAPGGNVELLRRESLAGLSAEATSRLLSRAYTAFLPVTPMPGPPLPLQGAKLVNFGPTVESVTPWMQLVLGQVGKCGLPGVVFLCGQRVWRLPPQLEQATHVLIWPWDASLVRSAEVPVPVSINFLLLTLNDFLTRTAVLVQPLKTSVPPGEALGGVHGWHLDMAHIALPLPLASLKSGEDTADLPGVKSLDGEEEAIVVSGAAELLSKVVARLGLSHAVGYIRLLRVSEGSSWIPLDINLGLPLFSVELCRQVCSNALKLGFLSAEHLESHAQGHTVLQGHFSSLLSQFTYTPPALAQAASEGHEAENVAASDPKLVNLPIHNLSFSGTELEIVDLSPYVHDLWQALI